MNPTHGRTGCKNGFTVIEILLVLAVLGILMAIAFPSLNRYVQSSRFQQGVKVFEDALVTARDTATRTSSPIDFEVDGQNVTWSDVASSEQLSSSELPFGISIEGGARSFEISGRGMPQVQERFDLSNETFSASVYLLPTGAVLR